MISAGVAINGHVPMSGSADDDYAPLATAAREGHAAIVKALLMAGANPRGAISLFGGTALHEACYFGHSEAAWVMTDSDLGCWQTLELDAQRARSTWKVGTVPAL